MHQEREETFVRAFIIEGKQDRHLQLLANSKRRQKAMRTFYHALETVPALTTCIANRDHFPEQVEKLLRQKGAGPTCYLLSPEQVLDRREMPLRVALDLLAATDGVAVVCCVPGRLAYYKAELTQYLLEKKPLHR